MESFRKQDMKAEQVLGKFMDDAFYSKLHDKEGKPVHFKRITDYNRQLQGVDVYLEVQGKEFLIDEKATLYYSNLMIPTFAFEIDSIQNNSKHPVEGWFLNEKLKTEYYMLIWPNIKCKKEKHVWARIDINKLQEDDFTIIEAMLIKKHKILDYLESYDWQKARMIEYAKKLRKLHAFGHDDIKDKVPETNEFYFYYTKKLAEQPINVVIRKEKLRELADADYFISMEKYVEIK